MIYANSNIAVGGCTVPPWHVKGRMSWGALSSMQLGTLNQVRYFSKVR